MPPLWEISNKKMEEHGVECWDASVSAMNDVDTHNQKMLDLFRGIYSSATSRDHAKLNSKIFLPIPRLIVEQSLPRIMGGLFPDGMPFKLTHRDIGDYSVAATHHELAEMQIKSPDMMNLYPNVEEYANDCLIFTHGVGIVYWDVDRNSLVFRTVDQEDCRPAPGARNIDDAEYWITRTYASRAAIWEHIQRVRSKLGRNERFFATTKPLIKRLPVATRRNEEMKPYYAGSSAGDSIGETAIGKAGSVDSQGQKALLADPDDDMVEVLTFRHKQHFIEFVRTRGQKSKVSERKYGPAAILLRYDNPFSEIEKGRPKPDHVGVFCTTMGPLPRSIIGTSPLSKLDHITRQANTLTNLRIDNLKGVVNPLRLIDLNSGIKDEDLVSKPLKIAFTSGPPSQYIHDAVIPDSTTSAAVEVDRLIALGKEVCGLTQYHQGMNQPSGRTPIGVVNRLLSEGNMIISQGIKRIKTGLVERLGRVMVKANERFMPEKFLVRTFGPKGRYITRHSREHLQSRSGIDVIVDEPEMMQDKQLLQSNLVGLLDVMGKLQQAQVPVFDKVNPEGLIRFIARAFTRKPSEADEIFYRTQDASEADQHFLATFENTQLAAGNPVPVLPFHEDETHLPVHNDIKELADKEGDDIVKSVVTNHIVEHERQLIQKKQAGAMSQMQGGMGGGEMPPDMAMGVDEPAPEGEEI